MTGFELALPAGPGPHPAIVGLHPANDRSPDHFLFRHLARVLPPRGLAVVRFDRRGDDVPLDLQVEDAMAVIANLGRRSEIDTARVGLWGFSQGAWVAPLAASRSPQIAFLVLLASTGVTPAAQMLYGTAKHARMAGYSEDVAERIVAVREVVDDFRRGRVSRERAQAVVDEVKDEVWFEHAYVPATLDGPMVWEDMDFDPEPIFAGVRVPTLLFYGEDDEWSPIDASVAAWRRAAARAGNPDVTIVRLKGTKHAPTLGGGEDDPIAPEYERVLAAWLTRVLGLLG